MANYALKEYEVKSVEIIESGTIQAVYLIAHHHHNKISNRDGFLLYVTKDIQNWNFRESQPLVNTILFPTPDEAFLFGEQLLKNNPSGYEFEG